MGGGVEWLEIGEGGEVWGGVEGVGYLVEVVRDGWKEGEELGGELEFEGFFVGWFGMLEKGVGNVGG